MSPAAYLALISPCWRAGGASAADGERHDEYQELRQLLLDGAEPCGRVGCIDLAGRAAGAGGSDYAGVGQFDEAIVALAEAVARACMGSDHLWHDLGLPSRDELSGLLREHFPALAARNRNNMRWKKFFYKELCGQAGIRACRAPSCDVCTHFSECFGSEERPLSLRVREAVLR